MGNEGKKMNNKNKHVKEKLVGNEKKLVENEKMNPANTIIEGLALPELDTTKLVDGQVNNCLSQITDYLKHLKPHLSKKAGSLISKFSIDITLEMQNSQKSSNVTDDIGDEEENVASSSGELPQSNNGSNEEATAQVHKINEDECDCVIVDNQSEASRNKSRSRKNTSTESQGDVSLPTSEDEDEYTDTSIHDDDTPKNHLKRKKKKPDDSIENFEN